MIKGEGWKLSRMGVSGVSLNNKPPRIYVILEQISQKSQHLLECHEIL